MVSPSILDIQTSETDVVNTVAETDFLTYTVPANTLGSTHALRVTIRCDYLNNSAGTTALRIKVFYGATLMYSDLGATAAQDANRRPLTIDLILYPRNATNSQGLGGIVLHGTAGGATTGVGDLSTDEILTVGPLVGANASEDSTASKVFKVTMTHLNADANISVRKLYSLIELM